MAVLARHHFDEAFFQVNIFPLKPEDLGFTSCTGFAECEHVKSQDLVFSLRALKPKSEIHYYYDKGLVDQLVQEQDANRAEGS